MAESWEDSSVTPLDVLVGCVSVDVGSGSSLKAASEALEGSVGDEAKPGLCGSGGSKLSVEVIAVPRSRVASASAS